MPSRDDEGIDLVEAILAAVRQVPVGKVVTFGDVAAALGDAKAARAVGEVLGSLPPSEAAPRHRVVYADGRIPPRDERGEAVAQLSREGVRAEGGKVADLEGVRFSGLKVRPILKELQEEQAARCQEVVVEDSLADLEFAAGLDLAYDGEEAVAAMVTVALDTGQAVEEGIAWGRVRFPYIPGYLGYRELPLIRKLLRPREGTVFMIDGQGLLHPRRFGIACHVGVALGVPSIGAAKSLLLGQVMPGGDIMVGGEVLGRRLGPEGGKGTYVSVGHMISLDTACRVVHRVMARGGPQPLRLAHLLATRERGARRGA